MKKAKAKRKQRIKENVAKAFVYTVINPILEGIKSELSWLQQKKYFWQFQSRSFEYIFPIVAHVGIRYFDHLELFQSYYPEISSLMRSHDEKIEELSSLLSNAYDEIIKLDDYKSKFEEARKNWEAKGKDFNNIWGAYQSSYGLNIIAEFSLNNRQELDPTLYRTAPFWNEYRNEFLQVRQNEKIKAYIDKMDIKTDEIIKIVENLCLELKTLRNEYAAKYDIPPIPLNDLR